MNYSKVKVTVQVEEKKVTEILLLKTNSLTEIEAHLFAKYGGYEHQFKSVVSVDYEEIIEAENLDAENKFYQVKWNIAQVEGDKIKNTLFKSLIETTSVEAASKKMAELLINIPAAEIVNVSDSRISEYFE